MRGSHTLWFKDEKMQMAVMAVVLRGSGSCARCKPCDLAPLSPSVQLPQQDAVPPQPSVWLPPTSCVPAQPVAYSPPMTAQSGLIFPALQTYGVVSDHRV